MTRWVDTVIAHRKRILAAWVVLFLLGGAAAANLGGLLSNRFSVPGAESERGLDADPGPHGRPLRRRVHARRPRRRLGRRARRASSAVAQQGRRGRRRRQGRAAARRRQGRRLRADLDAARERRRAQGHARPAQARSGDPAGVQTYLSGYPAINHDTQKIFNKDLGRGESIAIPIALLVMAFMFGTVGGIAVPVAFAAITIPTTLGFVWIFAHVMDMAIYVTNIVALIGLAIAVDYSMLVVFRFREELARTPDDVHARAAARRWRPPGRATLFSGDDGGDRARAARVHAAAVHALDGRRRAARPARLDRRLGDAAARAAGGHGRARSTAGGSSPSASSTRRARPTRTGFWHRLATAIMRRPVLFFCAAGGLMLALALPALGLALTGGDNRGVPLTTESTQRPARAGDDARPGRARAAPARGRHPRAGGASDPAMLAAERRFVAEVREDPELDPEHDRRADRRVAGARAPGQPGRRAAAA